MTLIWVNFEVYENAWMWFLENIYVRGTQIDSTSQFFNWVTRDYNIVDVGSDISPTNQIKFGYHDEKLLMLFLLRFSHEN